MQWACNGLLSESCSVDNLFAIIIAQAVAIVAIPILFALTSRGKVQINTKYFSFHAHEKPPALNPAHIFWLGHDLCWTYAAVRLGASRHIIEHGINQAAHHAQAARPMVNEVDGLEEFNLIRAALAKAAEKGRGANDRCWNGDDEASLKQSLETGLMNVRGKMAGQMASLSEKYAPRPDNADPNLHESHLPWPHRREFH